ncbi:hypothetical protein ABP79_18505 [Salmonella enterica subsp. enterica]|nr:hypothetical protein [Salmonella enterica subsp. enterica serovar Schwarzengrund]ECP4654197.1 hypothetical protein [Salmonella enterica subsp. enterica serovar Schwarzengrund]EIP6628065.1 hypothetical protein [Salmonella enterica subsp. enterica serovar Schwarzengrund]
MSNVKIYTATPADLSPPVQSESFCVDLVLASDYRELEAKCAALAAENAHARERHIFIRALAVSILEHSGGRMDWLGAMADATELCQTVDSVYAKSPATDAFLAEMRAQGVDLFAKREITDAVAELIGGSVDISLRLRESADRADEFAAQLRQEAAK